MRCRRGSLGSAGLCQGWLCWHSCWSSQWNVTQRRWGTQQLIKLPSGGVDQNDAGRLLLSLITVLSLPISKLKQLPGKARQGLASAALASRQQLPAPRGKWAPQPKEGPWELQSLPSR